MAKMFLCRPSMGYSSAADHDRLIIADLYLRYIATCRPPPSLLFVRRRTANCSTKACAMRDIYFTHFSLRQEVNIILSVNAAIIYSDLFERQPSKQ
jgi:hypothetical protein